jgi:hypothetical protein
MVMHCALFCVLLVLTFASSSANMNNGGIEYQIMNNQGGKYSTEFTSESPEYFDVYGEIQTRYSQVYWIKNDPIPLPDDIVTRFKGKVMAITGCTFDRTDWQMMCSGDYPELNVSVLRLLPPDEADQVIKTPNGKFIIDFFLSY